MLHFKKLIFIAVSVTIYSCTTKIQSKENSNLLVYIGSASPTPGKGVASAHFNTETGNISNISYSGDLAEAMFLHPDTINNKLYCIGTTLNPIDSSTIKSITSYSVTPQSGELSFQSQTRALGSGPCFIEYNEKQKKILTANYGSGNVCLFDDYNNKVRFKDSKQHHGSGPDESRQEAPHAHAIRVSPDNKFAYATDLGADKIMIYKINSDKLQAVDSIASEPGAGPRHIDFSPSKEIMAVVNELNCTVTTYKKDSLGRFKKEICTATMLPDTFAGFAKAADIHFSPDNRFLYASNRGLNSIVVYKVTEGNLQLVEIFTNGINWPRNFTLSPDGHYILVANKNANNITVYERNSNTGKIESIISKTEVETPVCIRFFSK